MDFFILRNGAISSLKTIKEELNVDISAFVYPYGFYDVNALESENVKM